MVVKKIVRKGQKSVLTKKQYDFIMKEYKRPQSAFRFHSKLTQAGVTDKMLSAFWKKAGISF